METKPLDLSQKIANSLRNVPDFPKPGVLFRDFSPLLNNPSLMNEVLDTLGGFLNVNHVDSFIGIESRGFILASMMAAKYQKGFIPLRKAGKLPPPTFQESYALEYGEATLEIAAGAGKVVILDDVLATGGTLNAGINLCERAGFEVLDVAVLIDLKFLNQFRFRGSPVKSLLHYE